MTVMLAPLTRAILRTVTAPILLFLAHQRTFAFLEFATRPRVLARLRRRSAMILLAALMMLANLLLVTARTPPIMLSATSKTLASNTTAVPPRLAPPVAMVAWLRIPFAPTTVSFALLLSALPSRVVTTSL
jgi:hypothetical protein